jgi:hypothetical protein
MLSYTGTPHIQKIIYPTYSENYLYIACMSQCRANGNHEMAAYCLIIRDIIRRL